MKARILNNLKVFAKLLIDIFREVSMANWRFIEMYAHARAQGKRFDWSKLLTPQPSYYKIGIDMNLLQFLMDWAGNNDD